MLYTVYIITMLKSERVRQRVNRNESNINEVNINKCFFVNPALETMMYHSS